MKLFMPLFAALALMLASAAGAVTGGPTPPANPSPYGGSDMELVVTVRDAPKNTPVELSNWVWMTPDSVPYVLGSGGFQTDNRGIMRAAVPLDLLLPWWQPITPPYEIQTYVMNGVGDYSDPLTDSQGRPFYADYEFPWADTLWPGG